LLCKCPKPSNETFWSLGIMTMTSTLKLLISATALIFLTACGNSSSGTDTDGKSAESTASAAISVATTVNAYRPDTVVKESPLKPRDLNLAPTPTNIVLGAPQSSLIEAARKSNEATATDQLGKPLQIGFGRDVAQTATALATNQVLKWQATQSGGQVAAINFSSSGAKGMRVGVLVDKLPATSTLRFYAKDANNAFEVKGADVLAILAKNLVAGDKTNEGRTYWSPNITGTDAIVEIEIPSGVANSSVMVSVPNISHVFMSTKEISTTTAQINYSGDTNLGLACQIDVTCSSPIPASTDAVAHLRFIKSGGTYICSGTMLNDNINSGTNYVLSANHCLSTQTVASTLETWFKYRATTCNNGATGEYYPTYGGADLLYTAYNTDSTLLKLRNPPSVSSILYAGWDATTPPATSTTGIHSVHHPRGDQQRLSRGSITGYSRRSTTNPNSFIGSNITSGNILNVTLTTGLTEGGSSGSALFKGTDANPIVIGQLYGGSTPGNAAGGYTPACTTDEPPVAIPPSNVYGRFDVAFNAGMKDWLVQGVKPVSQLFNNSTGIHYYTYGQTDITNFSASNPTYSNQGEVFKVSSYQTAGLSPVYRFYNTSNGSYFYTISEKERAAVSSNTPRMRYDGVVWYASATPAVGAVPVYSAFNAVTGSQHFTTSQTTRSNLIAANPQFKTDGIAFYVTP
jgi:lysyl endopeptidase